MPPRLWRHLVGTRGRYWLSPVRLCLRALDLYSTYGFLDFDDCLSIAYMERLGIAEIVSHDMDFDKVAEVTRTEPAS
jgi:predicted nucleic acid-binding protein